LARPAAAASISPSSSRTRNSPPANFRSPRALFQYFNQGEETLMDGIIYLIGLIVVIMAILSLLGLH
jgi:hypothetical protein